MNRIANLAALNAAKNDPDKWTHHGVEWTIELDGLKLTVTRMSDNTAYVLEDADGEVVKSGSALSPELARQEALFYAIFYVKVSTGDATHA